MALIAAVSSAAAYADGKGDWDFPTIQGKNHGFPNAADQSRERNVRFPHTPSWFKVRVAPARGDVICFIMHWPDGSGEDGCPHDAQTRRGSLPNLIGWHGTRMLFGAVPRSTTRAVVKFEDGSERVLTPHARLVAVTIPTANNAPGRRPISVRLRTNAQDDRTVKLVWPFS